LKKIWRASRRQQILTARLRLSFCENISHHLPVGFIDRSNLRLQVKLRALRHCYFSSDGSVPCLMNSPAELTARDIRIRVLANAIQLCDEEREDFHNDNHMYLFSQVQDNDGKLIKSPSTSSNSAIACQLPFKHPVVELIWYVQDEFHIKRKDWHNYSGFDGEDPVCMVRMTVNGVDRISANDGKWFRTIEPIENHTRTPKKHIYSAAFACYPEDQTFPSNSINFTEVEEALLYLVIQRGLGPAVCRIYANSWNLFRVERQYCGPTWDK